MPLYVIDTLVQFRHKYVVEAENLEHAYDEVVMRESGSEENYFDEVTQRYLGETILDGREITREDFHNMLRNLTQDNKESCSYWMGDKLIRKIDYER